MLRHGGGGARPPLAPPYQGGERKCAVFLRTAAPTVHLSRPSVSADFKRSDRFTLGVDRVVAEILKKGGNVPGLILASQETVKLFGRAGGNISSSRSVVSSYAPANALVDSANKAAVDAVTKSLAKEPEPRNIRVNSINPGIVETERVHATGIMESDVR
jgi:NAD(P)-dependent dehydrogenase (short-subunit alcohol dehydrogenase family)